MAEESRATATWEGEGGPPSPVAPPAEPPSPDDRAAIEAALAAGQLSVADPATGYHRSFSAPCPADGQLAPVWRVERGARRAITTLTMRCPRCGTEFRAGPDTLRLR